MRRRGSGALVMALLVAVLFSLSVVMHSASASRQQTQASVCNLGGLTGPALQENNMFCLNGLSIDGSVYPLAIHCAQAYHIIAGTPSPSFEDASWDGVQKTFVYFNTGLHAEHYNPSNGHAQLYDYYGHVLCSV